MFFPIVEAYWAVAVQALAMLPVCGGSATSRSGGAALGGSNKALVARLHGVCVCARARASICGSLCVKGG